MSTSMRDVLAPEAVCLGLDVASGAEAIAVLADRLLRLGKVKESYGPAVVERERTMPTGLPLGAINVAVPHTDPEHVLAPALAVATLASPVDFGSMDDPDEQIPGRVVVAMALTDKNAQLDMLQRIAGFIQNEDALQSLARATVPAQAVAIFDRIAVE
jgi:galactitol PTS system EIIA component